MSARLIIRILLALVTAFQIWFLWLRPGAPQPIWRQVVGTRSCCGN